MQKAEGWPDAVSLDPKKGLASPAFERMLRGWASTPVLLFAVGPQAQRGGWAADVAIALAQAMAGSGDPVILADLSLDRPELHDRVGIDNTEGLSDVFLFGASLEHVTRKLPAHSFALIPAAAFTPDAEEILTHRRWGALFEEYATTKTRLLLYLPVTVEGTGAFSDRVGHTVVLAGPEESDTVRAALSSDAEIMSVIAPPGAREKQTAGARARRGAVDDELAAARIDDNDFEKIRIPKASAREALIADLRARQRAALHAPPPTVGPTQDEIDIAETQPISTRAAAAFPPPRTASIHEPTFATKRVLPKPPRRIPIVLTLVLLLVISSAAAGWHYWGNQWWAQWRSGETEKRRNGEMETTATLPVSPVPNAPVTEGRRLPYSVAIAGYQVLEQAREMVDQLTREESDINFYVAPTLVQGAVFYRLFAGPLPDSATAAAVRDTLLARRIKTISTANELVSAPYAFLLGTFERRADADAKVAEATVKSIPSYIIPVRGPSGPQFNVYAGAYAGPGDAEFLREILKGASLPDTLVERTGSIRP